MKGGDDVFTFRRKENKYLITPAQQEALLDVIKEHLKDDPYGESTVCNIYLDTPSHFLIGESIDVTEEGRPYKEKLRIRSYGIPNEGSEIFLELKKKYNGIVYKRRIKTSPEKLKSYLDGGAQPEDSQIMREIDFAMRRYGWPKPAIMIFYERKGYFCIDDPMLRITVDRNTRYRTDDLSYGYGSGGRLLFKDDTRILEIKAVNAYPMWLVGALCSLGIKKQTFSKVAMAFKGGSSNGKFIRIDNREQLFTGFVSDMPGRGAGVRDNNMLRRVVQD